MTGEHRRRSIEASMPEISDAHRQLILTMDRDPEETFRKLEKEGYKIPGRKPKINPDEYE